MIACLYALQYVRTFSFRHDVFFGKKGPPRSVREGTAYDGAACGECAVTRLHVRAFRKRECDNHNHGWTRRRRGGARRKRRAPGPRSKPSRCSCSCSCSWRPSMPPASRWVHCFSMSILSHTGWPAAPQPSLPDSLTPSHARILLPSIPLRPAVQLASMCLQCTPRLTGVVEGCDRTPQYREICGHVLEFTGVTLHPLTIAAPEGARVPERSGARKIASHTTRAAEE